MGQNGCTIDNRLSRKTLCLNFKQGVFLYKFSNKGKNINTGGT